MCVFLFVSDKMNIELIFVLLEECYFVCLILKRKEKRSRNQRRRRKKLFTRKQREHKYKKGKDYNWNCFG